MNLKTIYFIFILILLTPSVNAMSIGVSPSKIDYIDILREGYAEDYVTITTGSNDPLFAHFDVNGEIAPWLSFEPNITSFNVSANNPYKLKIIVQPPEDARNDQYTGSIKITTDSIGTIGGRAGGFVKAAVELRLKVFITGEETIACRAGGFNFEDIEINEPFRLRARIINDGNVRITPLISFDIWDQFQENLLVSKTTPTKEILPTVEETITKSLSSENLDIGQYWVNMRMDECDASDILTFSIVEKGSIADKGVLEEIINKAWGYTEEDIQIKAKFRNHGDRTVSAKFKGSINLDDRVVKIIETDEVVIPSGQSTDFIEYFTPKIPGRYIITGRVVYNKKLTFEKSSVLNINEGEETIVKKEKKINLFSLLIYLIIVLTIVFIVRRIIKERKKTPF